MKGDIILTKSQVESIVSREVDKQMDLLAINKNSPLYATLPELPEPSTLVTHFRKRPTNRKSTSTHTNPVYDSTPAQIPTEMLETNTLGEGARPKTNQPSADFLTMTDTDTIYDSIATAGLKRRPTPEEIELGYVGDWVVDSSVHSRWLTRARYQAKERDHERMRRNVQEAEGGMVDRVWNFIAGGD